MKHRVLAWILSIAVVLSVAIPGTMAVFAEGSDGAISGDELLTPTDGDGSTPADSIDPIDPSESAEPAGQEPTCTCATETGVHESWCALYTEPTEEPEEIDHGSHMGACSDFCMEETCGCVCHLVEKLLATTSVEEFFALAELMTEEQYSALTDDQSAQINAHLAAIEPQPAPEIVLEESEPPVVSEIYIPAVNFTDVAPLGDPVIGK